MKMTRQAGISAICSLHLLFALPKAVSAQTRDSTTVGTTRVTTLSAQVIAATRSVQTLRDVPASVALLDSSLIRATPAKTVADFLKVVPGFAMRDFQSTLVAHPSRQAPVLRGLGGSSSSRVLVLLDGVPINDPFAGWIHWSRVPMSLLSRAVVVRGGGSGVWGDRALSGVISLETAEPDKNSMELAVSGGTFDTRRTSATATWRHEKLSVQLAGDLTKSDGFIAVPTEQRGVIDTPAGADDKVAYGRVTYHFTPLVSAYVSANVLDEVRPNATPLRVNSTAVQEVRAGMQWLTAGGSRIQGTVFGFSQEHKNYFSTESLDRKTEIPSLNQFDVPASSLGGLLSWSRQVSRHQLTLGGDLQLVDGAVNEDFSWVATRFTRRRKVDAQQSMAGAFLQDAIDLGRLRVLASIRQDAHRTENAHRIESDLTSNNRVLVDSAFSEVSANRTSYNLGARVLATRDVSLRGSVYTAFRSPNMNELYKPFREAGNVITEANSALATERLFGVEGGVDFNFARGAVRLTAFNTRLHDGIADVTVALAGTTGRTIAPCGFVPAGGTCRQRQPIDELKSTGLEAEAEFNPSHAWVFRAAYAFNPTEVVESRRALDLVGKEARGAARNSFTLSGAFRSPVVDLAVTGRYVGARFDDDLNALALKSFTTVDARASRDILQRAEIFLGIENIFDEEYTVTVANSGLRRNGMPRALEGGLRYRW